MPPSGPPRGSGTDEVDAISQSIRRAPGDRTLRQTRSALLEQAGLSEAAAYDRAASQ